MKILIVIPLQKEIDGFVQGCANQGEQAEAGKVGKLSVVRFPDLGLSIAPGGLGKVQFAIQTQHLLEAGSGWELVICAGAAGALVNDVSVGDIVVATETVEHDINNKFGKPLLPRFNGAETAIAAFRRASRLSGSFRAHFGPIASGDEDVVDVERKGQLHRLTGALAVAWEGAGGARACQFSNIPFIEIRGITDGADSRAATDFEANLPDVMGNVATLIVTWARGLEHK
jgi:adenosylhomocysteine nucleosidase